MASPLSFGETAAGGIWSQEGLTSIQTFLKWFQGLRGFSQSFAECENGSSCRKAKQRKVQLLANF